MKTSWFLLVSILLGLASCKKGGYSPPTSVPVITGFSPAHAGYNSNVTIRGLNLLLPGEMTVGINGVSAHIVEATDTSVVVQVPLKTGDGKINITQGGRTIESVDSFFYDYAVTVSSFAGDGSNGYQDGPGTTAKMNMQSGIAIDAHDTLYVADAGNYCIRKITPQGNVFTFAGKAKTSGYADGTGNAVLLGNISDIKYEKTEGAFYVIDLFNNISRIRKITPGDQVSTIAGGGTNTAETVSNPLDAKLPYLYAFGIVSLAIDAKNIYLSDQQAHYIRKISSNGITTLAGTRGAEGYGNGPGSNALFSFPNCIAVTADGNLLVVDPGNHRIREVTPSGVVSAFAGNGNTAIADANMALNASFSSNITSIVEDSKGNIYVMDNDRLRLINRQGRVITLTNNGYGYADGDGSTARFNHAVAMVIDSQDNLFISDSNNSRIRKVIIQ